MSRIRLDSLLAERGLAPSRSAAAGSIRAGLVRVGRGGERAAKPSQLVVDSIEVTMEEGRRFVSRGGLKLEAALDELSVDPSGLACMDVGASTGGFTDCLLQRGARSVVAVDVGRGQLDWGLRNNRRVTVLEGLNARELGSNAIPAPVALATIDVSFISLAKIVGPVLACIAPEGRLLAMVKPQFELGHGRVGKGGVVRDPQERLEALTGVASAAAEIGLGVEGAAPAGLAGPKGNREVFLLLSRGAAGTDASALLQEAIR